MNVENTLRFRNFKIVKVMTVAKKKLKSGREMKGYCVAEVCCWLVPVGPDQDHAEMLPPASVERAISNVMYQITKLPSILETLAKEKLRVL